MGSRATKQKNTEGEQVKLNQLPGHSVSLHESVMEQDAQAVRYCLQYGADVNAVDEVGSYTPLHLAATNNCKEIALELLQYGADVKAISKSARTPLHVAALSNASTIVSALLKQGANANATDMWGRTALHCSSSKEVTAKLLKHGADVNISDKWGQTPLHLTACLSSNSGDSTSVLLCHGANINVVTNNGRTALHLAARYNSKNIAAELLRRGASVNAVDKRHCTALHQAAKANSKEIAIELLCRGADINAVNNIGRTGLHVAAITNSVQMVRELLRRGANANVQDTFGSTPLHLAASCNSADTASELVQSGADIAILDGRGHTALHMSAMKDNTYTLVAKVILHAHPHMVSARNKDGQTPLHVCATEGSKDMVELLLKNKAYVNAVDSKGNTALHLAFSNKRHDIIPLLLGKHTLLFNSKDMDGNSFLHLWANLSYERQALIDYTFITSCGETLIQGGAVVNARNNQDKTPLHSAASWAAAALLVDNGAHPNIREMHNGETPLLTRVRSLEGPSSHTYEQQEKVESGIEHWQKVLKKGFDPWIANDRGETVLSVLLNKKNVHLAYALVTALTNHFKHDVNKKHTNGLTILHIACACGDDELQEMIDNLLKNRANVNEPSTTKETPLHIVCRGILSMEAQKQDLSETMHFWTACRLLSYAADPSLQDDKGMSCFDVVEDIPQMFDLLSKPVDPGSIPPLLKWSDPKSATHRAKVAQVVRGHNSTKIHFYHYHKEPIGSGAFGHVYTGIDERNGMEVAVKRIEKQRILRPETRREIANLVKLRECEEAVRYIGHYEDDHFVYLILDLMEGMLEEYLDTSPRDVKQDTSLCHDMIKGLAFLHQNNVLHRDIKPGNILYKTYPRVCLKLADFGLSTKITTTNDTTATWTVMHNAAGTRCWMAPELLQGDIEIACSEASDVFACGLVIHFILTGKKHPFAPLSTDGRSNIDIKNETERNIMSYELAIDTGLSHEASHVITTMLLQDKSSRPNAATVLCHPFFWSKTKMSRFIEAVGNQPEIQMPRHAVSKPSPVEWQLENTLGNEFEAGPWESSILEEYLEMASCGRGRRYDTYSAVDLVRFVRNSYAHVSDATRSSQSQKRLLDEFVYFSTFPSMLMDVYNAVTAHGWDKQRGEIKRVLEME